MTRRRLAVVSHSVVATIDADWLVKNAHQPRGPPGPRHDAGAVWVLARCFEEAALDVRERHHGPDQLGHALVLARNARQVED